MILQTPADVAWASDAFITAWGAVTPYPRAPELCVEIVSPSNSKKEMQIKKDLYLEVGAQEVWAVYMGFPHGYFHSRWAG